MNKVNPLSANPEKWSNTLKQIVGNLPTICLSVFDHFMNLALKGLRDGRQRPRTWGSTLYEIREIREIISTNLFMKTLAHKQLLFIEKLSSGSSHLEVFCKKYLWHANLHKMNSFNSFSRSLLKF